MLKMASESFIHALLLFLGLFLKISLWVPPILLRLWGFLCVRDAGRKGNKIIDVLYNLTSALKKNDKMCPDLKLVLC